MTCLELFLIWQEKVLYLKKKNQIHHQFRVLCDADLRNVNFKTTIRNMLQKHRIHRPRSWHVWRSCCAHDDSVTRPPGDSSLFVWPNMRDVILSLPCSSSRLESPLSLSSPHCPYRVPLSITSHIKTCHILHVDHINLLPSLPPPPSPKPSLPFNSLTSII